MKDLFTDGGHLFAAATLHYELPDYVLNGDTQMDKVASLEDSCFADPVSRLFPVHTRGHVFASAVYLAKQADVSPDIAQVINDRAEIFGISEDIQKVASYVSTLERRGEKKVAAAASPFVIKIGTPVTSKIAGAGPDAVLKAASRFFDSIPDMEPRMVTEAAIDLVKAADDNGVEPSLDLLKYAGVGSNDDEFIAEQKLLRIGLIPDPMDKRAARELIANIKTAEDLLVFDRKNHLDDFYGERLDPAHHVFHSGVDMSKVAAPSELEQIRQEFARDNHTYQAVAAAIGEDRAVSMLKAGSLELSDTELGLVRQYLGSKRAAEIPLHPADQFGRSMDSGFREIARATALPMAVSGQAAGAAMSGLGGLVAGPVGSALGQMAGMGASATGNAAANTAMDYATTPIPPTFTEKLRDPAYDEGSGFNNLLKNQITNHANDLLSGPRATVPMAAAQNRPPILDVSHSGPEKPFGNGPKGYPDQQRDVALSSMPSQYFKGQIDSNAKKLQESEASRKATPLQIIQDMGRTLTPVNP